MSVLEEQRLESRHAGRFGAQQIGNVVVATSKTVVSTGGNSHKFGPRSFFPVRIIELDSNRRELVFTH
ncbi:hypothetical protein ACFX15_028926 [Malus domestica]